MQSSLHALKSCNQAEIPSEQTSSIGMQCVSLLQQSQIHCRTLNDNEAFGKLNSLSLKHFALPFEQDFKLIPYTPFDKGQGQLCEQDPLYNVLSLMRGHSEYCPSQNYTEITEINEFLSDSATLIDTAVNTTTNSLPTSKYYKIEHNINSSPEKDHSSNSPLPIKSKPKLKQQNPTQTKISTKNVTKNMGKLLFKFIWKNKSHLSKHFPSPLHDWQSFITMVRTWKRENNVTREYLLSKWQTSPIFRVASHHFFRRRGIPSIFESHIECKGMHLERLRRFQEATGNPNALDRLS